MHSKKTTPLNPPYFTYLSIAMAIEALSQKQCRHGQTTISTLSKWVRFEKVICL
jgi:hypothetical protein